MGGQQLYKRLGVDIPFDPKHKLVSSPTFSLGWLALIRLSLAFYTLFTALFVLIWEAVVTHNAQSYFSYFTDLSYLGLVAYFCASGIQTIFYARGSGKSYPLQKWPRFLQFLHLLLLSTILTYPILVTIVYWALLASSSTFETPYSAWANISRHALNTVFVLFEIALTRVGPTPWIHMLFLVIILGGYLGVAYITHATQGIYPYNFLDPSKQGAVLAAYIVGIGVGECIVFAIVQGLCIFREWLVTRSQRRHMPPPPPPPLEELDDWQTIERPATPMAV